MGKPVVETLVLAGTVRVVSISGGGADFFHAILSKELMVQLQIFTTSDFLQKSNIFDNS